MWFVSPARHWTILVAETFHVRNTSCSSRMTIPCSEGWRRHCSAQLKELSMCIGHVSRDLDIVVYGDDFYRCWMRWRSRLTVTELDEKFGLTQKAWLGSDYDSETKVLNWWVTYSDSGQTWEADPWNAELTVTDLGLDDASTNEFRRRQAERSTWPRRTWVWQTEYLSQRVSETDIAGIRPTRHLMCLQGMQSRRRESNTCRPHTSETYRTILTPQITCLVGVPATERREHRDDRCTLRCWRS